MSYATIEELPSEVKEKLPSSAQEIFMSSFNTASSDDMSREEAMEVAWESVRSSYEEGEDGKWELKKGHNGDRGTMYGG
jgi:cation transport regulator